MCWPALAAEPLKFKVWKEQQILESQNEVLRVSARLRAPKAKESARKADELAGSGRFEKAGELTDRDLKEAQESLEIARSLTLQEYAEVYVAQLQDDPTTFAKLVDSLSKDELAQLMKILVKMRSEQPGDSKRNSSANLPPSSHS